MRFTPEEYDEIKKAVVEVEAGINGEIVPVIAQRSDDYLQAAHRGGIALALFAALDLLILQYVQAAWIPAPILLTIGLLAFSYYLGMGITLKSEYLTRLFSAEDELNARVDEAARSAFLEHEVFHTEARTGILIYMSLLEHRVLILADSGIHKVVQEGEWEKAVGLMVDEIKAGRPVVGLKKGILESGHILISHGFKKGTGDQNELHDDLRIG